MSHKKTYQKTVYVQRMEEGTVNEWLNVTENVEDLLADGPVAIYELTGVKQRQTVVDLR